LTFGNYLLIDKLTYYETTNPGGVEYWWPPAKPGVKRDNSQEATPQVLNVIFLTVEVFVIKRQIAKNYDFPYG